MPRTALDRIAELNPDTDSQQIVQLTLEDGLLWDFIRALELALFRTFAAPSISRLLDRTSEFERHGQKRYDDTTLILLNILRHGCNSDTGRAYLARMNRSHSHYAISNEDFLFVLSTFVIDPILWCERHSWRALVPAEQQALFKVWIEIGQHMGLKDLPASLDEMTRQSWAYVEQQFVYSAENERVGQATLRIVQGWLPRGLRGLVSPAAAALLDERTRTALGLRPAPPLFAATVKGALRLRAAAMRRTRLWHAPNWPTGHLSYPQGYGAEQLAPQRLLQAEAGKTVRKRQTG